MEKDFVPYEEVLALKELGFDEPSISGYSYPNSDKLLSQAILYQQAFRWFREKHNLMFQIFYLCNGNYAAIIHRTTPEYMDLVDQVRPSSGCVDEVVDCYSYEEAEQVCLDRLIKIVKNK